MKQLLYMFRKLQQPNNLANIFSNPKMRLIIACLECCISIEIKNKVLLRFQFYAGYDSSNSSNSKNSNSYTDANVQWSLVSWGTCNLLLSSLNCYCSSYHWCNNVGNFQT